MHVCSSWFLFLGFFFNFSLLLEILPNTVVHIATLSFTLFKPQRGWDPCAMLDSSGVNSKNVTQILITQSLWERTASGNRCHYCVYLFICFFHFLCSTCCVGRCKLQIGGVWEQTKGVGVVGVLLPWDIYPRKIFTRDIVWSLLNSDREKERECWGKNKNCNHTMLEGNTCSSREEKKRTIKSRDFYLWKTERKLALHFK